MAGGATCRRGASAARVVVDGGGPGRHLDAGGVAGDGLRRRHGSGGRTARVELSGSSSGGF